MSKKGLFDFLSVRSLIHLYVLQIQNQYRLLLASYGSPDQSSNGNLILLMVYKFRQNQELHKNYLRHGTFGAVVVIYPTHQLHYISIFCICCLKCVVKVRLHKVSNNVKLCRYMEKFVQIPFKSFLSLLWHKNLLYVIFIKQSYHTYCRFVNRLENLSYFINIQTYKFSI